MSNKLNISLLLSSSAMYWIRWGCGHKFFILANDLQLVRIFGHSLGMGWRGVVIAALFILNLQGGLSHFVTVESPQDDGDDDLKSIEPEQVRKFLSPQAK